MSLIKKTEDILNEVYGDEYKKGNALKKRSLANELLIHVRNLNNKLINENEELKNELSTFNLMVEDINFNEVL